jgi:hypothetical protein
MGITDETADLLEAARFYADRVSADISDRQNDPRAMCFWNIHNRVKMAAEILDFYDHAWNAEDLDEQQSAEVSERVVTVTKDMFVGVVSAIEKTAKEAVGIYPASGLKEKSLENRNYLYLRNIIEASRSLGYIGASEFGEWEDILVMRNLAAHNNSVADRSKVYVIGEITISMRPGRMMKGPMDTFIVLTARILELFYAWLTMMDGKFGPERRRNRAGAGPA